MGTVFTATSKAAEAPEVDEAMYDMRFDGTDTKRVKGGQYTKDTEKGDLKIVWQFTLLDDDGDPIREDRDGHENFGKPIQLEKLTGTGFNIASKTVPAEVKVLKALQTPAEFAAFEAGEGVKEADLIGRIVQGEVFVKENGWPGIGNIIAARKKRTKA